MQIGGSPRLLRCHHDREVLGSLVVDLEYLGRESYLPLFVVLRPGSVLHDALRARINGAVRTALSPRFVPDDIFVVA